MAKVLQSSDGAYIINCPACGCSHCYDSRWTFNGDFEKPTFSPSYLRRSGHYMPEHKSKDCWCTYTQNYPEEKLPEDMKCIICHSYVTDGKLQFLSDCTHIMAGQTVELEDV